MNRIVFDQLGLAFGEGFGAILGAMILNNPQCIDTLSANQGMGNGTNLQTVKSRFPCL